MPRVARAPWPDLPLAPWRATRDTLHMWTQIVGKTLLAAVPPQNHWWHVALRVSARGLASARALDGGRSFEVELDLLDQQLVVRASDGRSATMPLEARPVRDFYREYMALLATLGLDIHVWPVPVEVAAGIPFDADDVHAAYDPVASRRLWEVLRRCDGVLRAFAAGYVGKQSPVHFFWGSFDLASTRFSGRRAPEREGIDRITREAYSHEVISFGFWPGGELPTGLPVDEPILYAYAAPEPDGLRDAPVPAGARYDTRMGEFVLPYATARAAADPADAALAFFQAVYDAGARLGEWDRDALERTAVAAMRADGPAADAHPQP